MTSQRVKIYTRRGDSGETDLRGGGRVPKDDVRLELCGTIDELNSALGLARTESLPAAMDILLSQVQNDLFLLGAQLAAANAAQVGSASVGTEHITILEEAIDLYDQTLPPLAVFILPGGTRGAAVLHLARTVCRRAERRLVTLVHNVRQSDAAAAETYRDAVVYLNRLSDLLFVLARAANAATGRGDVPWRGIRD